MWTKVEWGSLEVWEVLANEFNLSGSTPKGSERATNNYIRERRPSFIKWSDLQGLVPIITLKVAGLRPMTDIHSRNILQLGSLSRYREFGADRMMLRDIIPII
jgi:hypothetical protein